MECEVGCWEEQHWARVLEGQVADIRGQVGSARWTLSFPFSYLLSLLSSPYFIFSLPFNHFVLSPISPILITFLPCNFCPLLSVYHLPCVQGRVNIAGLRLPSSKRPACLECWYLTGAWELRFQEGFHNSLNGKSGSLCLYCFCKQYGLFWTSAFLLRIWNFDMRQAEYAYVPSPNKNLRYWVSNELP